MQRLLSHQHIENTHLYQEADKQNMKKFVAFREITHAYYNYSYGEKHEKPNNI